MAQPDPHTIARPGRIGVCRADVLRFPRKVPKVGGNESPRIQATGHKREPGRRPGHHSVRPGKRTQRQQFTVYHRRTQQRRGATGRRHHELAQGAESGRGGNRSDRPAEGILRQIRTTTGGEQVHPGQGLAWSRRPEPRESVERGVDPQGTLKDRIGDRAGPNVFDLERMAFQAGAGHGRAQGDLGGESSTAPAQSAVGEGPINLPAGGGQRFPYVGQIEQWRQWRGHTAR